MKTRPLALVESAAQAWVRKKFTSPSKRSTRETAWRGLSWKFILVHAVVKWPEEIEAIGKAGVEIIPLHRVLADLGETSTLRGGAGTDLSDVIEYFYKHSLSKHEPET
jgi:hypothetical protein